MVVHYRFAILIPPSYPIEMAGPIMCAGVTMYSPLINFKVKPGSQVQCQSLLLSLSILLAVLDDCDGLVANHSLGWNHRPGRTGTNGHSTSQSDGCHCDRSVVIYVEEDKGH